MCGAAMRGVDALPWSKTPSRAKGSRRSWETYLVRSREAIRTATQAEEPNLSGNRRGVGRARSTDEAPEQSRDGPGRQGMGGGGGRGGKGRGRGSADRQASPGRRTGIGMPPKRVAHGSRLRADQKASDAITSDLRQEPGGGVREEAGMSLPVQVWSVQSRAGRTGASLAGVAATRGPKRRQRLDGVWHRLPKSACCGGRAGARTSESCTSCLVMREAGCSAGGLDHVTAKRPIPEPMRPIHVRRWSSAGAANEGQPSSPHRGWESTAPYDR